jgi:hypothetical protein
MDAATAVTLCVMVGVAFYAALSQLLVIIWVLRQSEARVGANILPAGESRVNMDGLKAWLFRRSMGWVVVIFLLALTIAGMTLTRRNVRRKFLKARHDLAPFTVVQRGDVDEVELDAPPPHAIINDQLRDDQLTAAPVLRDDILTEAMLLHPAQPLPDMTKWQLFTVHAAAPAPAAGTMVELLGVKENAAIPEHVTDSAIVLGAAGGDIVVAVPPKEAEVARTYLLANRSLLAVRALR